jgi:adiponectin receptor
MARRNGAAAKSQAKPSSAAPGPDVSELRARHRQSPDDTTATHNQPQEAANSSSPFSSDDEHPDPPPEYKRPRRPSTTELLLHKAVELETTIANALTHLLHWDDLPPWRRDNPSILRGYRPTSNSFLASLHSVLHVHNETVNIWTHLLGCLAFFAIGARWLYREVVAPRYATATAGDVVAFACFFAGATVCLGASAAFHTLSNHSEKVAKWGNKLDYSGIVFLIVGSYVAPLWYGFYCEAGLLTLYLGSVRFGGCLLLPRHNRC